MKKFNLKDLTLQSLIAAIYVVLTIVFKEISFGIINFRISEILVVLILFSPKHLIGVTLGCLISNIFSEMAAFDVPIGTSATLIAGLLMILFRRKAWTLIFPTITNAFAVGWMLWFVQDYPFWESVGFVALGEFVITFVFGLPVYMFLKNSIELRKILEDNK
ncbi:MAG TPA: QueT transporter family protein [Acholeplasmataceae bacterium]|jgi:uncharacterized membrane protein|nr:QueT transporter family protein [Acholeplasmataceae bacterium]HPX72063.1 QueT transporter family protein [Acholeplasmataceae bacterium]HQC31068.1 QueT transporter family protein [Acholeplasmataceae bacterium]